MRMALLGATDPMARDYLHAVSALSDAVEFVGLVEPAAVGQTLAGEFGVRWAASLDDLTSDRLDAVIVGGAIEERPVRIEQAATRVRAVLSVMPLGWTRADAERAIGCCAARGVSLHPAWPWRFLSVVRSLRGLAADGSLGSLLCLTLQHRARRPAPAIGPAAARATMLQTLNQALDLVRWVCAADVVDVHAEIGKGLFHPDGTTADAVVLSVTLATGSYATLDVSLSLPPTFPVPEDLQLETIGTGGWVRLDAQRQHIQVHTDEVVRWSDWGSRPLEGLMNEFVDAMRCDHAPSLDDALRVQSLALSVLET